jgi:hypothetical protein
MGLAACAPPPLADTVPVRAAVQVRFDPPASLVIIDKAGSTKRIHAVADLGGRVAASRGDTLEITLTSVRQEPAAVPAPAGARALVIPGPGVTITLVARRPRTTEAMVGVAVLALFLAYLAALSTLGGGGT